jgi:uncharacterized protein (DUF58 family)
MKRRLAAWIAAIAAAALMYLFENNTATRIVLVAVLAVPFVMLLSVRPPRIEARIELKREGREIACKLLLKKGGRMPLFGAVAVLSCTNAFTGEQAIQELPLTLWTRREKAFALKLRARHCGEICVKLSELRVADAFGFRLRRVFCASSAVVTIPPELFPMEITLQSAAQPGGERYSTTKAGNDPSETYQLREYIPGDAIAAIVWKLSQKLEALIARDFGLPADHRVLLLLESGAAITPQQRDAQASALASLSHALTQMGAAHTIGWQDAQQLRTSEDLHDALPQILRNAPEAGAQGIASCFLASKRECAFAHVLLISPYVPPDMSLLRRESRVTVLLTADESAEEIGGISFRKTYEAQKIEL